MAFPLTLLFFGCVTQFVSKLRRALCKALKTFLYFLSMIKQSRKKLFLKLFLHMYMSTHQDKRPFKTVYKRNLNIPRPISAQSPVPAVESVCQNIQGIQTEVHKNLQSAAVKVSRNADKNLCSDAKKKKEKVWLSTKNIHLIVSSYKFAPCFFRPFMVFKQVNPVTYCLKLAPFN